MDDKLEMTWKVAGVTWLTLHVPRHLSCGNVTKSCLRANIWIRPPPPPATPPEYEAGVPVSRPRRSSHVTTRTISIIIVTWRLKAGISKSKHTSIASQRLCKHCSGSQVRKIRQLLRNDWLHTFRRLRCKQIHSSRFGYCGNYSGFRHNATSKSRRTLRGGVF
jgi:hypothetical protein